MFDTILHVLWFLLPLFFFVMALWSKLEQVGGKARQEHPMDFVKQGLFVLACVLVALGIDLYFLENFVEGYMPREIPLGFYQVLLLPLVLWLGAKAVGPTKDIKISKAPHTDKRKR